MDFLSPLIYSVSNIDMWKFKMNAYLKALGLHVYLATTKKSYFGNDKYLEANAQALDAHTKQRLSFFDFSLWFRFYSVEHIEFSQGTNDKHFEEEIH